MFINIAWTCPFSGKKHRSLIRASDVLRIDPDTLLVEFDRRGKAITGTTTHAEILRLTSEIVSVRGFSFNNRPALFLRLPHESGRHKPQVATLTTDGTVVMTTVEIASDARWLHEKVEGWAEEAAGQAFEDQATDLLAKIREARAANPYVAAIDRALKSAETPAKRTAKPVDGSKPH